MARSSKKERLKAYMDHKVKPLFDKLFTDLLIAMPDEIIPWSVKWLNNFGKPPVQNTQPTNETKSADNTNQQVAGHQSDGSDDEADDIIPIKDGKNRAGVSAEAYGEYNKKADFKPRVIKKTPEQDSKIKERLIHSFMFQALEEKDLKIVIDAMEEKSFKAGDFVIKQGDEGNELYVIDKGELDCTRVMKAGEQPKKLKTYKPGESFGELALLYNAPRAATIKAASDSICYALDRETFNNIVKDAAVKKREHYKQILSKIELLSEMNEYERTHIGDGLSEQKEKAGDIIIKQGDPGDKFYMIATGELEVTKIEKVGDQPKIVFNYKSGDYFGELSLLNNQPRSATVTAKQDCLLLVLDKESFTRLLGPIEDILKRNQQRYDQFVQAPSDGQKGQSSQRQSQVQPNLQASNQPSQHQPATNQQSQQNSVHNQPNSNQPTSNQPAPNQPAPNQPAPNQPAPNQPAPNQPSLNQSAPNQPASNQSPSKQPIPNQPTSNQPTSNQPAPNQPAPNQPAPNQPAPNQPAPNQPIQPQNIPNQQAQSKPQTQPNQISQPNQQNQANSQADQNQQSKNNQPSGYQVPSQQSLNQPTSNNSQQTVSNQATNQQQQSQQNPSEQPAQNQQQQQHPQGK